MRNESGMPTIGDSPSDFFRNLPDAEVAPAQPPMDVPPAVSETKNENAPGAETADASTAVPVVSVRDVTAVDPSAETLADHAPPIVVPVTPTTAAGIAPPPDAPPLNRRSLLLIVLISYASAVTLALLYLLFAWSRPRPHALESLPDVPPLDVEHGEVMKLAPPEADLPPGHQLELGESRRFGNILVEPLRVVEEPVTFQHYSEQSGVQKPPTEPVLKLWVRFTNVSGSQTIAPLDSELLYRRAMLDDGVTRSNQFVCRSDDRADPAALVLIYDHPPTSEWDLSDQQIGIKLAPGESVETYLPSADSGASLSGKLRWRVHFRKGYSPRGFGVTTLVDVVFDSDDVEHNASDPPAA